MGLVGLVVLFLFEPPETYGSPECIEVEEDRGGAAGIEEDLLDCTYEFPIEFVDIELDERLELPTFDPLMTVCIGMFVV